MTQGVSRECEKVCAEQVRCTGVAELRREESMWAALSAEKRSV